MRLINSRTLKFHEFEQSSSSVPPYAILSHTWGEGEVTFRDMSSGSPQAITRKKGYAKITQTCRLARENDLEYVWIDTCCIDKSSSAELSESINSMFMWYGNAATCYVFLSDFITGKTKLGDCRWWTRGWTLQELLAPKNLTFYDATWKPVGTKITLITRIAKITRIREAVLWDKREILLCPVSQRMSWAAFRQTTRVEDEAYCLLGIFGIHLPLLYGEGRMAFRRLQEEIIRRNIDLTIFFWHATEDRANIDDEPQCMSLFAESPSVFGMVKSITPVISGFPEFFITNKGVFFSHVVYYVSEAKVPRTNFVLYRFFLGRDSNRLPAGILLRKIGPGIFCRARHPPILGDLSHLPPKTSDSSFYIVPDPGPNIGVSLAHYRRNAFHLPSNEQFQLQRAVPRHLWDATDSIFLREPKNAFEFGGLQAIQYPGIVAMEIVARIKSAHVNLIILSEGDDRSPIHSVKVFDGQQHPKEVELLFGVQNEENSIPLADFRKHMANIASLSNRVEVLLRPSNQRASISVSLKPRTLRVMWEAVSVSDFVFTVVEL
ncbi:heterokaryon incompatibility protein-domain-containing protein [Xylaria sp. FL1777]|nr:heterokaryon incompatibility protein-domain-containing protein [Xylaria sp. FL1777]